MRRNKFLAIQGPLHILRGRFEGQDKNPTKILMFTHSPDRGRLSSAGDKPHYVDAQSLSGY